MSLYAQQTLNLTIKLNKLNSQTEFIGNAKLTITGQKMVSGEIIWSIIKIDPNESIWYGLNGSELNTIATESVKGTYNASIGMLNLTGIAKKDSRFIVEFGVYHLVLIGGSVIGDANGAKNNKGKISGIFTEENVVEKINKPSGDITGPIVSITSPDITRGAKVMNNGSVMHIAGNAKDESGVFSVVVNGNQAIVDKEGNFSVDLPMDLGKNPFMLVARDLKYNETIVRFEANRATNLTIKPNLNTPIGKYYALLIAVQDYQDPAIQKLDGPIGDMNKLDNVLEQHYTFDPANVTKLKNPTRSEFFEAFDVLSSKVTSNDNVIIFYAGHGNWDENRKQGYWYPADAKLTKRDSWITNADLIEYIGSMKAKHTLLISDACFAGSIFKTRSIENATRDIKEMYNLPSRKAMTSGAMKQVPDKSVFVEYLVKRLATNKEEFLSAEQLFSSFKAAVINNSSNGQVPQFGEIRESGDEGGNFIFIKKKD